MRGRVPARRAGCRTKGITPAYAGKRRTTRTSGARYRDHPRVCGEEPTGCYNCGSLPGSPPRMRGRAEAKEADRLAARITPAYAGKRACSSGVSVGKADHPRVCGEEGLLFRGIGGEGGSPPRMRGREPLRAVTICCVRITPAYAGKRSGWPAVRSKPKDHPRVCGEEWYADRKGLATGGSPPRMRGRVVNIPHLQVKVGITPAYAGKSAPFLILVTGNRDHPRVCGEELWLFCCVSLPSGSPPRMRGRVACQGPRGARYRITPAYAGKS